MKEDTCEFPLSEYDWKIVDCSRTLRVTRKKPKVKVEWKTRGDKRGFYESYGWFFIVQFRVTGWTAEETVECKVCEQTVRMDRLEERPFLYGRTLYIGLDARDNWSAPVLLPESVYSRLDEITRALEDRANGGKG